MKPEISNALTNALTNGDFETGNMSGWWVGIPLGGSANVVTTHTGNSMPNPHVYSPVSGTYFAELKTDGPGSFTTIRQSMTLDANAIITGWAAFDFSRFAFLE